MGHLATFGHVPTAVTSLLTATRDVVIVVMSHTMLPVGEESAAAATATTIATTTAAAATTTTATTTTTYAIGLKGEACATHDGGPTRTQPNKACGGLRPDSAGHRD